MLSSVNLSDSQSEGERIDELFAQQLQEVHSRTDQLFAYLMISQWILAVVAAIWISPQTWSGAMSQTHVHVWAAVFLGGAITALPVFMAFRHSGRKLTRQVIVIGQMLTSALLIHLTGGRIETHFHVFGSLAFLACYRDWRVLVTAAIVTAIDHGLRGYYWPQSVYGVLSGASLRFIEHTGWVVFEILFLSFTISQNLSEMRRNAAQQAALESTNARIEFEVQRRTEELSDSVHATAEANRKLAEANIDLKGKNEELNQFSYVASHDLQEPVRKLISFSRLLEEDMKGELNENAKRDLGFIVDAAQRMRALIEALLELSRVGQAAIKSQPVQLDHCAETAIENLSLVISEANATILHDPLPSVIGNPTMLTQLFQNLIGNGLKFNRQEQPLIHLQAREQTDHWILSVRDNGIGMNPQHAERIFQPFQRLNSRAEFAGTGIGLAICKKTVSRHHGEIWVESEKGKGTTFLFTLPKVAPNHTSVDVPSKTSTIAPSILETAPGFPGSGLPGSSAVTGAN